MSKEYIVIISEGEKTEKQIIENIHSNFFKQNKKSKEMVFLPFKTNIYALWNVLKKDDFETEIIDVMIERDEKIAEIFKEIDKNHVSEVYLFFDYDGHAYKEDLVDGIIMKMIETFDNETDKGKIYISYPMVEAMKDLKIQDFCSRRCYVRAKENIKYKGLVSDVSNFKNLTILNRDDWYQILRFSFKKSNCIVSDKFIVPTYSNYKENINQITIFKNQISKFIDINQVVAVLGSFPFFLIDYFGENLYKEMTIGDCDDAENIKELSSCMRSKAIILMK